MKSLRTQAWADRQDRQERQDMQFRIVKNIITNQLNIYEKIVL